MKRLLALLLLLALISKAAALQIVLVRVEGEINEGAYIALSHAENVAYSTSSVLLVELDTPGGLLSSTKKIVQLFLNSRVPVIVYVPKGAMCASAGSIILLSADVAAMANGTAIGAATPVSVGGAADEKVKNYLASYVRDIAREKGRNPDIAEKFVTEALSLTAEEAFEEGVIDVLADSMNELLAKIDGRTIRGVKLDFSSHSVIQIDEPLQAKLYRMISNPQLAVILLLLGIYLLIFGLTSPGVLPETVGAICLLLALAGIGVLNIDLLGVALLLLGLLLLIAELMTPTYGVLGAASVICVVLGLLLMVREPLMPQSFYDSFTKLVLGVGIGFAAVMTFALVKIAESRRKRSVVGEVVGERGEVIDFSNGRGFAKVRGEIWQIESEDTLQKGDEVLVVAREGLKLKVRRVERRGGAEERDAEVAGENKE